MINSSNEEMGTVVVVHENGFLLAYNLFQNTCNHIITHTKKNHEKLTVRWGVRVNPYGHPDRNISCFFGRLPYVRSKYESIGSISFRYRKS